MNKNEECLIAALKEILDKAKDHPMFMHHSFETRNYDAICDEGGESCDWTFIGIIADDAIKQHEGAK